MLLRYREYVKNHVNRHDVHFIYTQFLPVLVDAGLLKQFIFGRLEYLLRLGYRKFVTKLLAMKDIAE